MKNGKKQRLYLGVVLLLLVGYSLYSSSGGVMPDFSQFGQASFFDNKEKCVKSESVSIDSTYTPVVKAFYNDGTEIFGWQRLMQNKSFTLGCGEKATILSCRGSIESNGTCLQQRPSLVLVGNENNSCVSVAITGDMSVKGC